MTLENKGMATEDFVPVSISYEEAISKALVYSHVHDETHEQTKERILKYLKYAGFVILNKTLTVNQRNKASDAFHSNFQSIQATFDAIVKAAE